MRRRNVQQADNDRALFMSFFHLVCQELLPHKLVERPVEEGISTVNSSCYSPDRHELWRKASEVSV